MYKIEITKIGCREFDQTELVNAIRRSVKVMSWGCHAWTVYKKLVLRFKVEGNHHKGHVYISLNFMDTFDIHLTSTHGNIKKKIEGIYIDQLIDVLDKEIEYIPEYQNR